MALQTYLYDADAIDRSVPLTAELIAGLTENQLLWIDLDAFDEGIIQQVAALLRLPSETVSHLLATGRRPSLYNHGNFAEINLVAVQDTTKQIVTSEIQFIVAANLIFTAHSEPIDFLESFDERIRGDSDLGKLSAPDFLTALLDWHLTNFFRMLEKFEQEVDALDEAALRPEDRTDLLPKLIQLRQRSAHLRRLVEPHREVYSALLRPDFLLLFGTDQIASFAALNDKLERIIEATQNARELLVGSFEMYATQTAQRTNEAVRTLTILSALLLPATVVTGIMGMSVKASIYEAGDMAFWGSCAVIVVLVGWILWMVRRRRWL